MDPMQEVGVDLSVLAHISSRVYYALATKRGER
jgi:hypothetical protein